MKDVLIEVGDKRIQIKLPIGYSAEDIVRTRMDSPNTTEQREWVTITIKEYGWNT